MELINAINERHSVRQYSDRPIEAELLKELQAEIEACNREGQLHIQLVTNEPKAFDGFMAHYGKFSGVKNYIALIGKKRQHTERIVRILWGALGAQGAAAGSQHLLGGDVIQKDSGCICGKQQ